MLTACIRYTFNLDKVATLKAHIVAEQEPIHRSGVQHIEYFLPTDFAGPTNEAMGLIDFRRLTDYERYRATLTRTTRRTSRGWKRAENVTTGRSFGVS